MVFYCLLSITTAVVLRVSIRCQLPMRTWQAFLKRTGGSTASCPSTQLQTKHQSHPLAGSFQTWSRLSRSVSYKSMVRKLLIPVRQFWHCVWAHRIRMKVNASFLNYAWIAWHHVTPHQTHASLACARSNLLLKCYNFVLAITALTKDYIDQHLGINVPCCRLEGPAFSFGMSKGVIRCTCRASLYWDWLWHIWRAHISLIPRLQWAAL